MKTLIKSVYNLSFLLKAFWKYGKIYSFVTLFMMAIITPINALASVLFTQKIIDLVAANVSYTEILKTIFRYLSIVFILGMMQYVYDALYKERAVEKIQSKIKKEIYDSVLKTDYKYFDDPAFYNNYTWAINEYVKKTLEAHTLLLTIVRSLSIVITMFSLIFLLGPWIIVFTVIEMIINVMIQMKQNKIAIDKRDAILPLNRRLAYVHRIFYQREYSSDIKTTNLRHYLFDIYEQNTEKKLGFIQRFSKKLLVWTVSQNIVGILYNAIIMAYISYSLIVSKSITGVGKFMSLLTANSQLSGSLNNVFSLVTNINNLSLYVDKIKMYFDTKSNIENQSDGLAILNAAPFSVSIRNLNFKYENSNFELKKINIEVRAGAKIAIVGANGSGKTTLLKLLLRLYDVDYGSISYNELPIQDYNLGDLRNKIGVSFQATNVYAMSMANNMQLYSRTTENELNSIVKKIGLVDVLNKSSGSLESELTREFEKDGIVLSAGEQQKIGLARVMCQDFNLLLMDEPSSTLDPVAEYDLAKLLFAEANKTTTIIISHRLSMIRDASCIYVMENGEIREFGTHEQLMLQKGLYHEMFTKQADSFVK